MRFLVTDSMGGGYAPKNKFEYTLKAKDHPGLIDPEGEYTFMSAASQEEGDWSTTTGAKFYEKDTIEVIHEDKEGNIIKKIKYMEKKTIITIHLYIN